ncbi:MAG: hypothetical protein ACOY5W_17070 [Pseudomonadota bacterium]
MDGIILKEVDLLTVNGMQQSRQERIPFSAPVECPDADPGENVARKAAVGLIQVALVDDQKLVQKLRVTLCIELTDCGESCPEGVEKRLSGTPGSLF